jgi:hypothetical protein
MRVQPLYGLVLGVVLFAAGCKEEAKEGGSPAPAPSPTSPPAPKPAAGAATMGKAVDACSMLSKADAEAATGRKLADPTGKTDVWSSCRFTLVDPPAPIVELTVVSLADSATAKQAFEEDRTTNVEQPEPTEGIGEAAFWDAGNVLVIRKGSYLVKVNISTEHMGGDKEFERKAARPIAEKVLAKLP